MDLFTKKWQVLHGLFSYKVAGFGWTFLSKSGWFSWPSTAVNLRWGNIDFLSNMIKIGDKHFTTKSKRQRKVPISKELLVILSSLKRSTDNDFVFSKPNGFPFNDGYVSRSFKKACRKVGIREEVTFHSLRHGFATRHAEKNTSPMVLKDLLGHAHIETTMRYVHVKDSMLEEAMEDFN